MPGPSTLSTTPNALACLSENEIRRLVWLSGTRRGRAPPGPHRPALPRPRAVPSPGLRAMAAGHRPPLRGDRPGSPIHSTRAVKRHRALATVLSPYCVFWSAAGRLSGGCFAFISACQHSLVPGSKARASTAVHNRDRLPALRSAGRHCQNRSLASHRSRPVPAGRFVYRTPFGQYLASALPGLRRQYGCR